MARRLLTECPYCHRKVSYFAANILKTKGEHSCKGCKCISNVVIHPALYGIGSFAVVISLLTLVLLTATADHSDYRNPLFVLMPFIVFYLVVPFFVRLGPCQDRSAVNRLRRKSDPIPEAPKKVSHKKQPKPIELNVGDDFTASFMRAKNSVKSYEQEYDENDSRIIREDSSDSDSAEGLDYDISSGVQNEKSGEEDDDVRIYKKPSEQNDESNPSSDENEDNTISFKAALDIKEEEKTEEDEKPDQTGSDVSFLFGRKPDSDE